MIVADSHILITGAARRVGRKLAEHFAGLGARVTAHYHTSEEQAHSLAQVPGVQILQADLRKPEEREALLGKAIEGNGPLKVLINSASVFFPTPLSELEESQWDDLMAVHAKAPLFLSIEFAKRLGFFTNGQTAVTSSKQKEGLGVILNIIDSDAGRYRRNYSAYIASKAALLSVSKCLAAELAPSIRVNSISPGPVIAPEHYTQEQKERSSARTLLGRWGEPEDICSAAEHLIENNYLTGVDLKVDGGRFLQPVE